MDITPSGNLRIVFSGPLRVTRPKLGEWEPIPRECLLAAVAELAAEGLFEIRPKERDQSATEIFDLGGTSKSPYPLDMVAALDLPLDMVGARLLPVLKQMTSRSSPFATAEVNVAVLRIFGNGYGAVVIAVELAVRPNVDEAAYLRFLSEHFNFLGTANEMLRKQMLPAVRRIIAPHCARIVSRCGLGEDAVDGEVHFLSLLYVIPADWDPLAPEDLRLNPRLRPMLQPETGDDLISQSPFRSEVVLYTSGFHMYVWNRRVTRDPIPRTIALVSFLTLMNILWDQLDFVRSKMVDKLVKNKVLLYEKTDIDERLEILYRQVMVNSLSWRRDFSAFRDEIDKRWKMGELKQYCLLLLAEMEARSARKQRKLVGGILFVVTLASLVSIVADGFQLVERARRGWFAPAGEARPALPEKRVVPPARSCDSAGRGGPASD